MPAAAQHLRAGEERRLLGKRELGEAERHEVVSVHFGPVSVGRHQRGAAAQDGLVSHLERPVGGLVAVVFGGVQVVVHLLKKPGDIGAARTDPV
ncbi:MAG: hypothetical protein E6H04_13485 [Bacillati bacterium ANGP1]|uniref:Uncharacterized protein n=1 Tax=Candidatus Segetimicrobium genomatis TaxID=2569760 RepID=A0A537J2R8_9BACT|nr:MAG: hypothetical protein E6H04_13485 [Terrabacteria group bacterium ANGP1]